MALPFTELFLLTFSFSPRLDGRAFSRNSAHVAFRPGGAIRIAHYDVIDDVITRKL